MRDAGVRGEDDDGSADDAEAPDVSTATKGGTVEENVTSGHVREAIRWPFDTLVKWTNVGESSIAAGDASS